MLARQPQIKPSLSQNTHALYLTFTLNVFNKVRMSHRLYVRASVLLVFVQRKFQFVVQSQDRSQFIIKSPEGILSLKRSGKVTGL